MNNKLFIAIAALLIITVGAAVYVLYGYKPDAGQIIEPPQTQQDEQEDTVSPEVEYTYSYKLSDNPSDSMALRTKGQILRTNAQTNQTEVIVDDVTKAYTGLLNQSNSTLWELVIPDGSDKLYFTEVLLDTDAPLRDIIEYNAINNKFTKLEISKYWQGFGPRSASESTPYAISGYNPADETDERSLFLLDFKNDTAKLVVKLPENQTLNACYQNNCLGGYFGESTWLDGNSYQISIYNPNETEQINGYTQNKLIEKRKFEL